jgi:hypothetical protein
MELVFDRGGGEEQGTPFPTPDTIYVHTACYTLFSPRIIIIKNKGKNKGMHVMRASSTPCPFLTPSGVIFLLGVAGDGICNFIAQ